MDIQKFVISRDDNIYEAWPDVVLTRKGNLICVFSECTHHRNRSYTRLVMKKSTDRGRTWSEKIPLTEGTNGLPFWNSVRISRLKDNRLVIVADQVSEEKQTKAKNYLWFGDEEGNLWDGPFETPVTGIVPDKLCELVTGRWLLSAHRKHENGYLTQYLWYSDDHGNEWNGPITLAGQEGLNLCEVSILPLSDGTLVAFLRENSGEGRDCYKAISNDHGESWHGIYRMPLPGCHRPVAGVLQSGKIMIAYRFMQGGKIDWNGTWTQNFFCAITDEMSAKAVDRNQQWTRILPIDYDRSPVADLGYCGWVQFDDGEIYIANYIVDDAPNGQIRGYSLWEDYFILNMKSESTVVKR